jgi:hypothetical protein
MAVQPLSLAGLLVEQINPTRPMAITGSQAIISIPTPSSRSTTDLKIGSPLDWFPCVAPENSEAFTFSHFAKMPATVLA